MRMVQCLIIGAGPYGLALANYLHEQGTEFKITGKPMELWREHTFPSADLRSDMPTSEIVHPTGEYAISRFYGMRYPDKPVPRGRVAVSLYREYVDWVLAQLPYPIRPDYVMDLQKEKAGFVATLANGDKVRAHHVVIATGIAHHLKIPRTFQGDPRVIHSYQVQFIATLRKKRVLVVGAGQSAAESIDLLLENENDVEWYSRKPPRFYTEPLDLPRWIFNLVIRSAGLLHRLPPKMIQRVFGIFSATTMTPDYQSRVEKIPRYSHLPETAGYDAIVTATGYRYDVKALNFLSPDLLSQIRVSQDIPVVDRQFRSSVPNLYFIGPITEPFFGPPMKFIVGARYMAPRLARVLAS